MWVIWLEWENVFVVLISCVNNILIYDGRKTKDVHLIQYVSRAWGYKTFFMLKSTVHEIQTAHKNWNTDQWRTFLLKVSRMVYLSYY